MKKLVTLTVLVFLVACTHFEKRKPDSDKTKNTAAHMLPHTLGLKHSFSEPPSRDDLEALILHMAPHVYGIQQSFAPGLEQSCENLSKIFSDKKDKSSVTREGEAPLSAEDLSILQRIYQKKCN